MTDDHIELLDSLRDIETPYLTLDLDRVRANVDAVRDSFGMLEPQILYSMKANAESDVLRTLHGQGCGFDVASLNEIRRLEDSGIPLTNVIFSSTVKVPGHISEASSHGVDRFAFDSRAEVEKLARHAPGARVVLRLEVPHAGSRWPLAGKFGVPAVEALDLLQYARSSGLRPYGLTFHVGSQCLRVESWTDAVDICARVWKTASDAGIELSFLNIGGGLPTEYMEDVPTIGEIGARVAPYIRETFGSDVTFAIEPGRFLVGDAGTIATTVIGTAVRRGKPWVFVDLSIYAGLLEVIGGWTYPLVTAKDHLPKRITTLAGPTCDSTDILASDAELPQLEVGDRVLLLQTGAYTISYRQYNGFAFPTVVTTEGGEQAVRAA